MYIMLKLDPFMTKQFSPTSHHKILTVSSYPLLMLYLYTILVFFAFSLSVSALSFFGVLGLPIRHHVAHATVVLSRQLLFELLARQPLEIGVAEGVAFEVGLTRHDAAAEEKCLPALCLDGAVVADGWLNDEVCNGHTAHDPGVHVDTGSLLKDSLRSLIKCHC